jgi:hypothetical protein
MINGTVYEITRGNSRINGITYTIGLKNNPCAILYTDGNMSF